MESIIHMKVLLASGGSVGDVQPLLALAFELRALGHEPHLCVTPSVKDWVESLGFPCVPLGRDLRQMIAGPELSAQQLPEMAAQNLRAQVRVLIEAARGCALILGNAIAAASSVAEALKIRYIFVAYCPVVLPSPDHPPPQYRNHHPQTLPASANLELWAQEEQTWNDILRETLNEERVKLGLAPVDNVRRHILTQHPWLAADPALGPPGQALDLQILQTGAWLMPDSSPLPEPLERFLADGEPPVYLGFGSMRAAQGSSQMLIEAARALGLRSIVSQGWGNLAPIDAGSDCIGIGYVAHAMLFPRVAAVVHHGGAGTTTAAVRAGKPQVIVPHLFDQYYWAHRVQQLGVGAAGPASESLSVDGLVRALCECLLPEVTIRAQELALRLKLDGARFAARRIDSELT